jgi:hypothetical protein
MRNAIIGVVLASNLACLCGVATAQTIYKSERNGVTLYSTTPSPGAVKIAMAPLSVVSAQKADRVDDGKNNLKAPEAVSSGQKNRDAKRIEVLDEELQRERAAMAGAEKDLAAQDAVRNGDERNYQKKLDRLQPYREEVELHKKNVEAISKEMNTGR